MTQAHLATQESSTARRASILTRLKDQIDWYDKKSARNQGRYKGLKILEIVAAALIPFIAGLNISNPSIFDSGIPISSNVIAGILGVLIVVLESVQSLNQYQNNWINYRSTCEKLKHEEFLWNAKAGDYVDCEDPDRLLAERTESLVSTEHAQWISSRENIDKTKTISATVEQE